MPYKLRDYIISNRSILISSQHRRKNEKLACPKSLCLSVMLFSSLSIFANEGPVLRWPSYPIRFAATLAVVLFFIIQYIRNKK